MIIAYLSGSPMTIYNLRYVIITCIIVLVDVIVLMAGSCQCHYHDCNCHHCVFYRYITAVDSVVLRCIYLSVHDTCFFRACPNRHHAGYVQTDLPAAQCRHVTYHSNQCACFTLHAHSTAGQCSKAGALLPPPPATLLSLISLPGLIRAVLHSCW